MIDPRYSIVMFAHNERKNIERSVNSVLENSDHRLNQFYIIANGCTDETVPILRQLAKTSNNKLVIVELQLGDKCNAWNEYVHSIAPPDDAHFFVDADVKFTQNAFPLLFDTLMSSPEANAVAGLPFSGRNIDYYRSMVIDKSCLFGNCYGVKNRFISLAREKNQRLPIGLSWIDSAITKFINSDIGNQFITFPGRVTYKIDSGYYFKSLSPFKYSDIKLYINRIGRYQLGKFQEQFLDQMEFSEWPDDLRAINLKVKTDLLNGKLKAPFYMRYLVLKRLNRFI